MIRVSLDLIDPNPWQPRQFVDEAHIAALAADIYARFDSHPDTLGLLQLPAGRVVNLIGQPLPLAEYIELLGANGDVSAALRARSARVQLAYGHNRLAAFRRLQEQERTPYHRLPLDMAFFSDEEMATAAWAENAQRKDLNPAEEADAIAKMMADFSWTQEQAAQRLHLNRATVANKLRLRKLPSDVLAQLRIGQLSERQALALLPLYDLPAGALQRAEDTCGYGTLKPSQIVQDAPKLSSDNLRIAVADAIQRGTQDLERAPFPADVAIEVDDVQAARCDQCPVVLKDRARPRCPDSVCWDRKAAQWRATRLAAASQASGIAACATLPSWGEYESLWDKPVVDLAVAGQCAQLHLAIGAGANRVIEGFNDVGTICLHGKGGKCACRLAYEAEKRRTDPAIARDKEGRAKLKAQIMDPAIGELAGALVVGHEGAWRLLAQRLVGEKALEWPLDRCQRAVARVLIERDQPYNPHLNLDAARQHVERRFGEAGLPAPWEDANDAAALQRRYGRVANWLERIHRAVPTIEAVRGNLDNLRALADDAAALLARAGLNGDEAVQAIADNIADNLRNLGDLLRVLERDDWSAEGFEEHAGWLWTPVSDLNVKHHIATAPAPILRYVLALAWGRKDHHTRAQALERELRLRAKAAPIVEAAVAVPV